MSDKTEKYQMSPYERYMCDPHFAALVDMLVSHLHRADFTTEDVRAASVVASVVFLHQTHFPMTIPREIGRGLDEAERWIRRRTQGIEAAAVKDQTEEVPATRQRS